MSVSNSYQLRQRDIIPQDKLATPILVIGAGAIGGWATLALAKSGFMNIGVFDFDKVEEHNVAIQPYGESHIGMYKVDALARIIADQAAVDIQAYNAKYTNQKGFNGTLIIAVDNMKERKKIFEGIDPFDYVIDFRMASQYALGFGFQPRDKAHYLKTLYTDEEAAPESCTAKATTFCATIIGGLVVKLFLKKLHGAQRQILTFDIDQLALKYTNQEVL